MTLREWLDRLEEFDPDSWGGLGELRTKYSEEELDTDLEAEITFRTEAGTVDRVVIRLLDDSDQVKVELDYGILQLLIRAEKCKEQKQNADERRYEQEIDTSPKLARRTTDACLGIA